MNNKDNKFIKDTEGRMMGEEIEFWKVPMAAQCIRVLKSRARLLTADVLDSASPAMERTATLLTPPHDLADNFWVVLETKGRDILDRRLIVMVG